MDTKLVTEDCTMNLPVGHQNFYANGMGPNSNLIPNTNPLQLSPKHFKPASTPTELDCLV